MVEQLIKEHALRLEDRDVRGRFEGYLPSGDAEFSLKKPVLGIDRVRITRDFLRPELELRRGWDYAVFLVRITERNIWYGRLWDPKNNPWINQQLLPKYSDQVSGTVQHYIDDFAAIVLMDQFREEAFLRRDFLPEGQHLPIHRTLERGDRIKALVVGIDHERLRIELDCVGALLDQRERSQVENSEDAIANHPMLIDKPEDEDELGTDSPLSGNDLLLVENDGRLRDAMVGWIKALGGEASVVEKPAQLIDRLKRFKFTHILVDLNIPEFDRLLELARRTNAHIAIWSGQLDVGKRRAADEKLPFLSKPLNMAKLREWVNTGRVKDDFAEDSAPEVAGEWRGQYFDHAALRADAKAILETLRERHKLIGGVWIREERDNVFSFRAVTPALPNSTKESIEQRLYRSIAPRALGSQRELIGLLPTDDPLHRLFDQRTVGHKLYFLALPFCEQGGKSRCVMFFNDGPWSSEARLALLEERDNIRRVIQLTNILDYVTSTEAFATAGRVAAGALHEVRTSLLQAQALKPRIRSLLRAGNIAEALPLYERLSEVLDHLAGLSEAELSLVQKHKRERLNVYRTVANIAVRMQQMMNLTDDKGRNKLNATLTFHGDDQKLVISISPLVLEQPLINILDNAIYHIPNELWARIEVSLKIVPSDEKTPIHIRVTDNGPGMSAEERKRLFEPRETSKMEKGYGLGLYISRNLVRAAGGEIECIDSFRWAGSTFEIRLPIVLASMQDKRPGADQ